MKKALRLFTLGFAALCALGASADDITFKVNVAEGADGISAYYGWPRTYLELHDGENQCTVSGTTYITMETNQKWEFSSITWGGVAQTIDPDYANTFNFIVNPEDEGKVLDITLKDLDAERTGTFYVNVDDVERVDMMFAETYSRIGLKNGMNTIKFNPETEADIYINSSIYDKPIYEVLLDDAPVPGQNGRYEVTLTEGCVLTINSHVPDKDITLTFNYNETGEGAISGVKVDETLVQDFDGKLVNLKAGQTVALVPNNAMGIDSFKMNGNTIDWTGGYEYIIGVVMDNTVFDIEAHPYEKFKITLKVNDPEKVNVYTGEYDYGATKYELAGTENELEVVENNPAINWKAVDGYVVTAATLNGEPQLGYNDEVANFVTVKKGDVVELTVQEIVYDSHFALYMNGCEAAFDFFSIADKNFNYVTQTAQDGYRVMGFFKNQLPLGLSAYSRTSVPYYVYLNDELQTALYNYSLELADTDCVKVFAGEEPTLCNVEFQVADDVNPVVVKDILRAVEDLTATVTCFPGTQFNIAPASTSSLKVTLNDVDVPVVDGTSDHRFNIFAANNVVKIEKGLDDGVGGIGAERAAAPVYNLQGVAVADSLENLPAGIYISRGRKVVVK